MNTDNDKDKEKDKKKADEQKKADQGKNNADEEIIRNATSGEYKYGFVTDIDTHVIPKGLNEDVVRYISKVKGEPEWLLEFRLKAYRHWLTMTMPRWAHLDIPDIDVDVLKQSKILFPTSTSRQSATMPPPRRRTDRRTSMKWTRSCERLSTSSAYRSKSRCGSAALQSMP